MRLSADEIVAIKAAGVHAFGADAVIRLFGSRVDDSRRGGDIDLHVEVSPDVKEWEARSRFENYLFARIEEQKVDVILSRHDRPLHPEKQAAQVNGAWEMGAVLFETAGEIRAFVARERLLEGLL